jgi:hypothetical protein
VLRKAGWPPVLRGDRGILGTNTATTRAASTMARAAGPHSPGATSTTPSSFHRAQSALQNLPRRSVAPKRPSRGPVPAGAAIQRSQRAVSPETRCKYSETPVTHRSPSTSAPSPERHRESLCAPTGLRTEGLVAVTVGHSLRSA